MTKSTVPSGNPLGRRDGLRWCQGHTSSQRNKIAELWGQKQFLEMRSPKARLSYVLFKASPHDSATTCQWSSWWILKCHTWTLRRRHFWRTRKYYISQDSARLGKTDLPDPSISPRESGPDQDMAACTVWVCVPGKGPGSTPHWASVGERFYQWRMCGLLDLRRTRCEYQLFRKTVCLGSL